MNPEEVLKEYAPMKYKTQDYIDDAEEHALEQCHDEFCFELKSKLMKKRREGKQGWDNPQWDKEDILRQLREHIDKGDMLDVAAFAMFAWNREM